MPVNTTRHDTIKSSATLRLRQQPVARTVKIQHTSSLNTWEGVLNTHISKLDTKMYPSILKWSLNWIQVANLPGYYETRTNTTIHITSSHNFSNVLNTMRVFLVYLVQHSQQYYHHQEKYVAYLHEVLSDIKKFPGFPGHSDGKVIVDTHPNFAPPWPNENIGNKKWWGTHGNYASELQCGPIFNEDGEASCFIFEQQLQSLRWIEARYSLHIIYYSNDILPTQVPYQDEHGNDFCTKINLLVKYNPEEKRKEYEYRVHTIKWIIIYAHHVGCDQ